MLICIEKRPLLTREEQDNSTGKVRCSAEIFACPKTPDSVPQSGNPSKGEEFLKDIFIDFLRVNTLDSHFKLPFDNIQQILGCYLTPPQKNNPATFIPFRYI